MGFLSTLRSLFGLSSNGDRQMHCADCKSRFIFDAGEQRFFKEKGFSDPIRCPKCRKKTKAKMKHRPKKKSRGRFKRRGRRNSLIDGDSPYQDE